MFLNIFIIIYLPIFKIVVAHQRKNVVLNFGKKIILVRKYCCRKGTVHGMPDVHKTWQSESNN